MPSSTVVSLVYCQGLCRSLCLQWPQCRVVESTIDSTSHTGQLFLEKLYTLGVIAHGAIGTNHVDGNTRLCTAIAAEALKGRSPATANPAPIATSTTPM